MNYIGLSFKILIKVRQRVGSKAEVLIVLMVPPPSQGNLSLWILFPWALGKGPGPLEQSQRS